MEQLKAFWKLIASPFKRRWGPSDYPLRYREQFPDPESEARWGPTPRWSLQVINWWVMGGLGETREAAFADFEAKFKAFIDAGNSPPRPGRGLPLKFASADSIQQHEPIARDFLRKILHHEYDQCFVSDQSSLHDWGLPPDELEQALVKIRDIYGVDLSSQDKLVISEILAAIASQGTPGSRM